MFSASKNAPAPAKGKSSGSSAAVTILTSGCHFNGKLFCRGSSRIGGRIEGHVVSEGLLIIEEEAVVTAEIKADEVIIQGQVSGKLVASGRVELCASARFDGDITTPVLIVREGAQFNGRSTMAGADAQAKAGAPKLQAAKTMPDVGGELKQADIAKLKAPEINVR